MKNKFTYALITLFLLIGFSQCSQDEKNLVSDQVQKATALAEEKQMPVFIINNTVPDVIFPKSFKSKYKESVLKDWAVGIIALETENIAGRLKNAPWGCSPCYQCGTAVDQCIGGWTCHCYSVGGLLECKGYMSQC